MIQPKISVFVCVSVCVCACVLWRPTDWIGWYRQPHLFTSVIRLEIEIKSAPSPSDPFGKESEKDGSQPDLSAFILELFLLYKPFKTKLWKRKVKRKTEPFETGVIFVSVCGWIYRFKFRLRAATLLTTVSASAWSPSYSSLRWCC